MLQSIEDRLAGDLEDQQRDRRRQIEVLDVPLELHARVAPDLVRERLERLRETLRAERGAVQLPDERADPVRGLLLRLADLLELLTEIHEVVLVEELARDVDLEAEPEQHLCEVVMEIAGDL